VSRSSIGLKLVMAVTGIIFVLYVLLHMYGNLMVFGGEDAFNTYAHHLRTIGEPVLPYSGLLWVIRVVLIVSVVLHAWAAFVLWARASGARSHRYAVKKAIGSSLSSRTMRWGGVALLLFVVFHILHLTTHTITPQGSQPTPWDNVVNSFDLWWVTLIYVLAMVALGFHLHHGVWSASQTLGWTGTARSRAIAKATGWAAAVVIAGGFVLPPLAILFGIAD
jgi:succinate dehydrogenase / fumarate reductase cytochrome b subunit